MDRGFKYYFGNGMRTAAKAVLKGGGYLRYYLYCFAALIGRMIPIFGAVFWVADMRRAKIAKREGELAVNRAFAGVDGGNKFGAAALSITLIALMIIGGVAAFAALGYGLYLLGYLLGALAYMAEPEILAVIFAVPAAAGAIIFTVGVLITFAPAPYIIDSNKKVSAAGVMTAATQTMRRGGKLTCFLNTAVPILIKAAFLAAAYGVLRLIIELVSAPMLMVILCAVWVVIALAVFMAFAPLFTLAADIANASLFEDISLDPSALENRTKGVFVLKARGDSAERGGLNEDLDRLFDTAPEPEVVSANTRYVPPTDYEPKMNVFRDTFEDTQKAEPQAAQSDSAESEEQTAEPQTAEQEQDGQVEL